VSVSVEAEVDLREAVGKEFRLLAPLDPVSIRADIDETLPDLLVMELNAQSAADLEAVQRYRSGVRVAARPLIVLTRAPTAAWESALLEAGADEVFALPFDREVARARIRRLLQTYSRDESAVRFVNYRAMIRQMAIAFIDVPLDDIDDLVTDALAKVGGFLQADRAYIFEYDFAARTINNTHEWCAAGIAPQIDTLQQVPMDVFPEWVAPHRNGRAFAIDSVADLPPGNLRDILMPQEIQCLFTVPMMDAGQCLGFVGVDLVQQKRLFGPEERGLLELFAQMAVSVRRRRTTQAMLQKLSFAVEQSSESIIITDTAARIEYVNDSFSRQTGFARDEAVGHTPSMLASGKTPHDTYARMWAALRAGRAWKGEFINRRKDGEEYYAFAIITPIGNAAGQVTHFVAVTEDVTEKKRVGMELDRHRHQLESLVESRTADLLVAKLAAERANQAKSEFLANMSHELRTPLNSILGVSEMLQMGDVYGPLNQRQHKALEQIHASGEHLLQLINEILDLARIEAGKFLLDRRPIDACAVAAQALEMMEQAANAKSIQLDFQPAVDAQGSTLLADEQRVRQVLLNLLSNAIKFTPHGGNVGLRMRIDREKRQLAFVVTDTGEGMDAERQARLFQPFTQFESPMRKKHPGSGLGLSIVKRLMDLHGGTVTVNSAPGRGSTFTVSFPLEAPASGD